MMDAQDERALFARVSGSYFPERFSAGYVVEAPPADDRAEGRRRQWIRFESAEILLVGVRVALEHFR